MEQDTPRAAAPLLRLPELVASPSLSPRQSPRSPRRWPLQQRPQCAQIDPWPLVPAPTDGIRSSDHPALLLPAQSPRAKKLRDQRGLMEQSRTQPKVLQELQALLASELAALATSTTEPSGAARSGGDGNGPARAPNMQRLRVFRRVFRRAIDEFSVYAPLLRQVQAEYDRTIDALLAQVRVVPVLQARMEAMQLAHRERITHRDLEAARQLDAMEHALQDAQGQLTALAATHAREKDETAQLRKQLEQAAEQYEALQRSQETLVRGLQHHDETLQLVQEHARQDARERQQLERAHAHANEEIAELKKTLQDLEVLARGVDHAADQAAVRLLSQELLDLHAQHQQVLDAVQHQDDPNVSDSTSRSKQVLQELLAAVHVEMTPSELDAMLASDELEAAAIGTRLADRVLTAMQQRHALQCRAACHAASDISTAPVTAASTTFVTEPAEVHIWPWSLTASNLALSSLVSTCDYLPGRGTSDDVPAFLRYDGVVRHLHYSRAKVEQVVSKVWAIFDDHATDAVTSHQAIVPTNASPLDASSCDGDALERAFARHLQATFPTRQDAIDCAYNVLAALERFQAASSECRLFWLTLQHLVPLHARQQQRLHVLQTLDALSQARLEDSAADDPAVDLTPNAPFTSAVRVLQRVLPDKTDAQFHTLHRALLLDQCPSSGTSTTKTPVVLAPMRARQPYHLIECLKAQFLDDILAFRVQVQQHMQAQWTAAQAASGSGGGSNATPSDDSDARMIAGCVLLDWLGTSSARALDTAERMRIVTVATGLSPDELQAPSSTSTDGKAFMVDVQKCIDRLPTLLLPPLGAKTTTTTSASVPR